jgi:hypothetical protein
MSTIGQDVINGDASLEVYSAVQSLKGALRYFSKDTLIKVMGNHISEEAADAMEADIVASDLSEPAKIELMVAIDTVRGKRINSANVG